MGKRWEKPYRHRKSSTLDGIRSTELMPWIRNVSSPHHTKLICSHGRHSWGDWGRVGAWVMRRNRRRRRHYLVRILSLLWRSDRTSACIGADFGSWRRTSKNRHISIFHQKGRRALNRRYCWRNADDGSSRRINRIHSIILKKSKLFFFLTQLLMNHERHLEETITGLGITRSIGWLELVELRWPPCGLENAVPM